MTENTAQTQGEPNLVFAVYTNNPIVRTLPPALSSTDQPDSYLGYFANEHGEKWVFEYNRKTQKGQLRGKDCSWKVFEIIDGTVEDLSLDRNESAWFKACWAAATHGSFVSSD